jgi:hypothetical protein
MAPTTAGYHRVNNIVARTNYGVNLQVVPGATIYVTETATGGEATIYFDPGLSLQIPGALLTANQAGWYQYYIPLNYNVTETISAVSGLYVVISNVVQNTGVLSTNIFVANEVVSGSGTSFTLINTPKAGTVALYNGAARLRPGASPNDYTISGANITMNYSLSSGALLADYVY